MGFVYKKQMHAVRFLIQAKNWHFIFYEDLGSREYLWTLIAQTLFTVVCLNQTIYVNTQFQK